MRGLCCCINAAGDTASFGFQSSKLLVSLLGKTFFCRFWGLMQSVDLPEEGTSTQPQTSILHLPPPWTPSTRPLPTLLSNVIIRWSTRIMQSSCRASTCLRR